MKLERLQVLQMPGIDAPFSMEPTTQTGIINLVTGPNASGKSTLLRCVHGLLYPKSTNHEWSVTATLVDGNGRRLEVRNVGGRSTWMEDGNAVTAPPLPPAQLAHCYLLRFEDLAPFSKGSEQALAKYIVRELTGGYDIAAVRERFPAKIHRARECSKALDRARESYDGARRTQVDLRTQQERLAGLKRERDAAEEAATVRDRVVDAEDYRKARRRITEIDNELGHLPAVVAYLAGNEVEQLERLEQNSADVRQRHEGAWRDRKAAVQALEDAGLTDDPLDVEALQTPRAQARSLGQATTRLQDIRGELAGAEEALAVRAGALASDGTEGPEFTSDQVHGIASHLEAWRNKQAEILQLRQARDRLPEQARRPESIETLRAARDALREWLAAEATATVDNRRWPDWLWLGVPLTITAVVAALFVHVLFFALPVLALAGVLVRARGHDPERAVRGARERFLATDIEAPEAWTRAAVKPLLEEIEAAIDEAAQVQQRAMLERELRAREGELEKLAESIRADAERLGVDARKIDEGFVVWLRDLDAYRGQSAQVADLRGQATRIQDTIDEARRQVIEFLAAHGLALEEDEPSAETLHAALDRLNTRIKQRDNAHKDLADADGRIRNTEADLERLGEQRASLFTDLGLDDGDEHGLRTGASQLGTYRALVEERQGVVATAEAARARIADDAWEELRTLAEADEAEALEQRREAAETRAGEASALRDEIATIEANIRQARNDRRLEAEQAKVQEARDALAAELDRGMRERAGALLMGEVERQVETVQRPEVLERAQAWFAAFTNHAYTLDVTTTDPPDFFAHEAATGHDKALDELSSGTRMQLLLAIRLGFAIYAEGGGEGLPLFIDQALATADPARFAEVTTAVRQVAAAQDRQVFYLTADPSEVRRWRATVGEGAVHELDVAAARGHGQAIEDPAGIADELPARLSSPAEVGKAAFLEQLQIPPVNAWRRLDGVHLYYVFPDQLDWVHLFADNGLRSAGQLQRYIAANDLDDGWDAAQRARVDARLNGAAAWSEAWCQGRGFPIGRAELGAPDSPFATSTRRDAIADKADELGGDPDALLAALRNREVKNVDQKKVEQLAEYLDEFGYLARHARLAEDERRARVVAAIADVLGLDAAGTEVSPLFGALELGAQRGTARANIEPTAPA